MTEATEVTVRDVPARHRFELVVGDQLAGFTTYRQEGDALAFLHTEVKDEYEGQGLGSRLARDAIEAARERGVAVLPYCPFVRSYLVRHPEQQDVVPASERHRFGLA